MFVSGAKMSHSPSPSTTHILLRTSLEATHQQCPHHLLPFENGRFHPFSIGHCPGTGNNSPCKCELSLFQLDGRQPDLGICDESTLEKVGNNLIYILG